MSIQHDFTDKMINGLHKQTDRLSILWLILHINNVPVIMTYAIITDPHTHTHTHTHTRGGGTVSLINLKATRH